MRKLLLYKIIIGVLSLIIILQWRVIAQRPRIKKRVVKKTPVVSLYKGKIAIVIDDWGYNLNNLKAISQIRYPLTAAILPNLSYSRKVAEELNNLGLEIILHLPLEPHEKYRLEKNTILTSFDADTIKNIIDKDLSSVAYAKGVSNHMGSLATEDNRTMEIIFTALRKKNLYFLDSLVSSDSICCQLASQMQLGCVKRDIFLDNESDPLYIRKQIDKLKNKAQAKGAAIGIGHDRKATLKVLKEALPELEKEGFKIVYVSQLLK